MPSLAMLLLTFTALHFGDRLANFFSPADFNQSVVQIYSNVRNEGTFFGWKLYLFSGSPKSLAWRRA